MHRWWIYLLPVLFFLGSSQPTSAVTLLQDLTSQIEYTFGGQITFRIQLPSDPPIQELQVFLRSEGESDTFVGTAELAEGTATYIHDLTSHPLRAFSNVEYWYRLSAQNSEAVTSEPGTFFYGDNRYDWQTLESGPIRVHWYEGDMVFGQSVMDAAQAGLLRAQNLLPLPPTDVVDIYVYASGQEMQSTLRLGALNWVAGHADPDLGVAVVSLPAGPDQRRETERQIPHELMHIFLYQATGTGYDNLPTWFKEGTASANELKPSPDYYIILTNAVDQDTLIPLSHLCTSFPKDASVYLAYAESDSFIRYLHEQYGSAGLGSLMESYAAGQGCEYGSEAALEVTLSNLEQQWQRAALGKDALLSALENLAPWLLFLLAVIAVPLILTVVSMRTQRKS